MQQPRRTRLGGISSVQAVTEAPAIRRDSRVFFLLDPKISRRSARGGNGTGAFIWTGAERFSLCPAAKEPLGGRALGRAAGSAGPSRSGAPTPPSGDTRKRTALPGGPVGRFLGAFNPDLRRAEPKEPPPRRAADGIGLARSASTCRSFLPDGRPFPAMSIKFGAQFCITHELILGGGRATI